MADSVLVDGVGIARSLGVSESVIGLTLVAGAPHFRVATSVVAALKKNPEMAWACDRLQPFTILRIGLQC